MHGTATVKPVQAYLVVYGVKDWSDSVNPEIYDHEITDAMFEYKNNEMAINTDIDMQNNTIKNLPNAVNDTDAVNKSELDNVSARLHEMQFYINNYTYRTVFEHFYDLEETSRYDLVPGVSGTVINGVLPNLVLGTDRFINSYSLKYGLKLSTKTHIRTVDLFNQNTSFTFFMSFLHDTTKTCEISFSNTLNIQVTFKTSKILFGSAMTALRIYINLVWVITHLVSNKHLLHLLTFKVDNLKLTMTVMLKK